MSAPLEGSVALVTGASSGIGAATARALAAAGASVTLAARRADRLEKIATELKASGGKALVHETDVTDRAQATEAVEATVREFGSLDILINNAGVMLLGDIEGASMGEWERMVHINLLGLMYTAHAALPHLLETAASGRRKVADMINISSVAGRVARHGSGVYNLTKFGVGAFSESLRQEVTRRHVRVGLVEPGAVDTELTTHLRPEVREQSKKRFGDMEILEANDIAEAIVYVATRPRRMAVNEILIRPTEQQM